MNIPFTVCPRGSPLYNGILTTIGASSKEQITFCTATGGTNSFCINNNYNCVSTGTQNICCPSVGECATIGYELYFIFIIIYIFIIIILYFIFYYYIC